MLFVFRYLDIAVVTAALFATPFITSKDVLFGVHTGREFRKNPLARRLINLFCSVVLGSGLINAVLAGSLNSKQMGAVRPLLPLGTVAIAGVLYYWAYRQLKPYAQQERNVREAELTAADEHLPSSAWLRMLAPFVLLGGAALYLSLHWNEIPERYPIHYGLDGQPNGWATRSFRGVYGFLGLGALISIWLMVLALATWFGSRRSAARQAVVSCFAAASLMMAVLFSSISLSALWHLPPVFMTLGTIFMALTFVIWVFSKGISLSHEAPEATDQNRWYAGGIYYNPFDPALMVQKRSGFGYTFNFGNRWSWALLAGTLMTVFGGFSLLR